jgi:hypothetical protein
MELLGDVCQMEAILVHLVVVLILAWNVCMVCPWESFLVHPMELLGDVGQVEAHFGPYGDNINLDAR